MATEFNDAIHKGFFMSGDTLRSGSAFSLRQSELTLAALRAAGVLDNMEDGTVPPALDKLWLDKNTDPAVLKEWDPTGSSWAPMTFDRLFGRAIVTALATPTGTGNAVIVAEPSPFIPHRMYSLTPIADNSGAVTIQVTGVGTFDVKYTDGTALSAQEFKAANATILLFTGVRFEVLFALADVYAARDQVLAVAAQFPALVANTMLVDNAAGTARENKTFEQVRALIQPYAADTMLVDNADGTAREPTPQLGVREFLGLGVGPLKNPHVAPILIDYKSHYGFNTCLFPRTDGGLTVVTRKGPEHHVSDAAQVIAFETYDKGLSRVNMRVAYEGVTSDDRNFASAVMGARFGIVAMRNGSGVATTPMFLYNDTQGAGAWTGVALTLDAGLPVGFASSPHGKIMRWPASAGGNDTTGWIVYFYSSEVIAYATTVDNGTTWSAVTPCITGTGLVPTEMAVARVGTQNKWFMVVRKEVTGSFAFVSTSTNMTTWTALAVSGIVLSKSPPYLVQDDDATWLYSSNRRGAEIPGVPQNTVIVSKIDASAFYNSAGASGFSDWRVVVQLPQWGTGYMDFVNYNNEWIAAINCGEQSFEGAQNGGGANALYIISNTPSAQGLALLRGIGQHKSALLNSGFQIWQNGTSGTGVAGRTMTADGWGVRRAGSVTGYEWSRQAGSNGGYALRVQRTAANTSTAITHIINVINSDDVKPLRGQHCNVSIRARKGANFSAASNILTVDVYSHTTESLITATDGTAVGSVTLLSFQVTLDANGNWTEYDTPALVPEDSSMVWVRVRYTPVGTAGAADYFEVDNVAVVPTPYKQPRNQRSFGEELALCQRYFRKTYAADVAPGTITNAGALQNRARGTEALAAVNMDWRFQDMRAVPTVSVYSPVTGAVAKIANVTGAVDIDGVAECVGTAGATVANNAAAVSGSTYRAHAVASALPW